jgi:anti-sigma factor RsiW
MNGNTLHEDLKAYLDGELSAERSQEIEREVASNPQLQAEVRFMRMLSKSLSSLEPNSAPSSATGEALASKFAQRKRPWFTRSWVWGTAAAAILAVIILPRMAPQMRGLAPASEEAMPSRSSSFDSPASRPMPGEESGQAPSAGRAQSEAKSEALAPSVAASPEQTPDVSVPDALRQVVKNGSVDVRVDDIDNSKREVLRLIDGWGGYIKSQSSGFRGANAPTLAMTVRVPVQKFDEAMLAFEGLGFKLNSQSDSEDVTAELVDLDARLRTLKAQEETYRRLLGQAKTVGQVMEVQDRLSQIRAEIESLDGQRRTMAGLARMSTIQLTMVQRPTEGVPEQDPSYAGDAWSNAVKGLKSAWRGIATAAIFVFVWAPIWLPVAVVGYLLIRRSRTV